MGYLNTVRPLFDMLVNSDRAIFEVKLLVEHLHQVSVLIRCQRLRWGNIEMPNSIFFPILGGQLVIEHEIIFRPGD